MGEKGEGIGGKGAGKWGISASLSIPSNLKFLHQLQDNSCAHIL